MFFPLFRLTTYSDESPPQITAMFFIDILSFSIKVLKIRKKIEFEAEVKNKVKVPAFVMTSADKKVEIEKIVYVNM